MTESSYFCRIESEISDEARREGTGRVMVRNSEGEAAQEKRRMGKVRSLRMGRPMRWRIRWRVRVIEV